ncbi:MAG TPA: sigma-70 family RNA polymerase sigma factor [Polyangia bacterium]|jgi:RNA polymerase sigma-70 factor (ECF subfamily)|nr:sigma-70 family RNA polymerase sigma factor [Polyangia bacterium]
MTVQELYGRYGSVVYRRARRLLGDPQAAQDACHEVFLRLFRCQPEFEQASPVTWLYKVTTNHCLNLIRDEQRRRKLLDARATAAPEAQSPLPLSTLLHGLPDELQEIAVYYFVDEMSQDEIAHVLGISQRTVSNRLSAFRGLAKAAWATDS